MRFTFATAGACCRRVLSSVDAKRISRRHGTQGREAAPAVHLNQMQARGMAKTSPIMIRIFKEEDDLEVWNAARQRSLRHHRDLRDLHLSSKLGP